MYEQIDPADPTKGFFVSYPNAQQILIDRKLSELGYADQKLELQEKDEICEAQLKIKTPNWFSRIGIPVLSALAGIGVGLGVGYAAGHH